MWGMGVFLGGQPRHAFAQMRHAAQFVGDNCTKRMEIL